jgi:hypothetical protein
VISYSPTHAHMQVCAGAVQAQYAAARSRAAAALAPPVTAATPATVWRPQPQQPQRARGAAGAIC